MAWGRRKSGPKSEKNQPLFLVYAVFLLSLSLSVVSATTTLITGLPTISSTIGSQHNHQPNTNSHCRFLSPLCSPSRFLLLLLPLPPAAISVTASATVLLSAPPRLDQPGLNLGTPASSSGVSPLLLTKLQHAERILVLHAAWLISMVAGLGQQPCGPGPDHLGPAWPKKRKGYVRPRSAQPKVPRLGQVV